MSKLIDLIRAGRWLLCRFFRVARHRKATSSRELVVDRGDARLVFLSTQPIAFPVELYLSQLESIHALSECVQAGTSSINLTLELLGHTGEKEVTNHFVLHFQRKISRG
ncbi:MAG TPA: hypothetical protein VLB46_02845 [Pyrinomonadaceae bacterium]|nr:hypothetical protein [Pyrinomonadaceae bacterium]